MKARAAREGEASRLRWTSTATRRARHEQLISARAAIQDRVGTVARTCWIGMHANQNPKSFNSGQVLTKLRKMAPASSPAARLVAALQRRDVTKDEIATAVREAALSSGCCPALLEPCCAALLCGEMRLHAFCHAISEVTSLELLESTCASLLTGRVVRTASEEARLAMMQHRDAARRMRASDDRCDGTSQTCTS